MAGGTKTFGEEGEYDGLAQRAWAAHVAGEPLTLAAPDFYAAFIDGHPGAQLDESLTRTWPGPGPMPIGAELRVLVVRAEQVVLG